MKVLIFSDVHGNYLALRHLMQNVSATAHIQTDLYRCLGDMFGYLADPLNVWTEVLKLDPDARLGNHDVFQRKMLMNGRDHVADPKSMGITSAESEYAAWTAFLHWDMFNSAPTAIQSQIEAHLCRPDVIKPRVEREDGYSFVYVHGSAAQEERQDRQHETWYLHPHDQQSYCDDIDVAMTAARNYALDAGASENERVILFLGHTHMPMIAYYNERHEVKFKGGH